MKLLILIFLVAAVVAAQVPPQKGIPAIAKAANGAVVSIIMSDSDGRPLTQGSGFGWAKTGEL
jgi:ABC-type thiamin/hydroxymethylpyrimidine transport system permease subunit